MPITLQTTYGKVDYSVTQDLKTLAGAVETLQQQVDRLPIPDVRALRAELQRLTARVDVLTKQVQDLQP